RAVGNGGVHVERDEPAGREVLAHPGERVDDVAGLEQVVDGVVEAGDQVELAVDGQGAHVGDVDVGAAGGLLGRAGGHLAGDVAGGHLPAALQQRQEALAGPAGHVEHAVAGEAVGDGQVL